MSARVGTWCLAGAGVAVAASVVAALSVLGSPAHQRDQRFDERRVRELSSIASAIEEYARTEGRLPARLADLLASDRSLALDDPSTGAPYGYRATDARHYALCAVFATDNRSDADAGIGFEARWVHPAGRHCVARALARRDAAGAGAAAAATPAAPPAADAGRVTQARKAPH